MSVLVILYKYNLNMISDSLLSSLIRIIVNSLDAQFHQCRRIPTTILTQDTLRRPEIKEPSINAEQDQQDREPSILSQVKSQIAQVRKSSIECDETESELVAIPESDLSDSGTLQGSIDGGMSDEMIPIKKKVERTTPKVETSKSVSEGMRMMFSSAILSPPVNVQKAIVVTQTPSSKTTQSLTKDTNTAQQIIASATTCQLRTVSAVVGEKQTQQRAVAQPVNGNGNRRNVSPIRALGRQQRIIDTNGQQPSTSSSSDEHHKKSKASFIRHSYTHFGSPESPLSRMDILSPPDTSDISTDGNDTPLLTPTSVKLEFPMPERLLPIGNMGNVAGICERVREALAIPDISHLKSQDNLDRAETSQTSSRGTSPRKLMKQVALVESPPHVYQDGVDERQHMTMKKAHVSGRSDIEEKRFVRKVRAYSVQCSDSRLRYAGSWPPNAINDEDNDDEEEASMKTNCFVGGAESKQVRKLN